jgi:DNA-binding transcriptional ArsR family regulator
MIMNDKAVIKVEKLLKRDARGATITELVVDSKLSRSAVRIALAKLEGAERVELRNIGMAKVYSLRVKK